MSSALLGLIPDDLRATLRRAELRVDATVPPGRGGPHPARAHGPGYDFRDHRPYVPGDDPRRLDWRAAARRDRLVVRRSEALVAMDLVFVIDAGAGMVASPTPRGAAPEAGGTKWERARSLCAWLGELARRQADRVGYAIGGADDVEWGLPVSGAPEQIRAFGEALRVREPAGSCPWDRILGDLPARLRRRSTIVVASDLWDPSPGLDDAGLVGALERIVGAGHVVLALQILGPDELEFPWSQGSALRFVDPRRHHPAIEASGAAVRAGYLASSRAHLERLTREFERTGVRLVRHRVDEPARDAALRTLDRLAGRSLRPRPAATTGTGRAR